MPVATATSDPRVTALSASIDAANAAIASMSTAIATKFDKAGGTINGGITVHGDTIIYGTNHDTGGQQPFIVRDSIGQELLQLLSYGPNNNALYMGGTQFAQTFYDTSYFGSSGICRFRSDLLLQGNSLRMNDGSGSGGGILNMDGGKITNLGGVQSDLLLLDSSGLAQASMGQNGIIAAGNGFVSQGSYGVNGSFLDQAGNTITVFGGIIVALS